MNTEEKPILYLISGQGADQRLFQNLHVVTHQTVVLDFPLPHHNELLPEYAMRMSSQIDTQRRYSILGVSLGGMIAVEMAKFLKPEHLILVSSAKGRKELPPHYRLVRTIPLYKLFSGRQLKAMGQIARGIFEPASRAQPDVFRTMLEEKDPRFLKRTIHAIINWRNEEYPEHYVHIHGDQDRTLPLRWVDYTVKIAGGSHMMIFLRGEEVSKLVQEALSGSD